MKENKIYSKELFFCLFDCNFNKKPIELNYNAYILKVT